MQIKISFEIENVLTKFKYEFFDWFIRLLTNDRHHKLIPLTSFICTIEEENIIHLFRPWSLCDSGMG
jgi:hypothetical protein